MMTVRIAKKGLTCNELVSIALQDEFTGLWNEHMRQDQTFNRVLYGYTS
jgi:hypothetical protein